MSQSGGTRRSSNSSWDPYERRRPGLGAQELGSYDSWCHLAFSLAFVVRRTYDASRTLDLKEPSMPLAVTTLGNRNSGKSTTWNTLFGATVKTGKLERRLYLNKAQYVTSFLVSGSPEERDVYVGEIITVEKPSLVLCSTQYIASVRDTYDFFFNNGYDVHVQWLNPGYSDSGHSEDSLELLPYLLKKGATIQMRDGRIDPRSRVRDLTRVILGWATYHDLVHTEFEV